MERKYKKVIIIYCYEKKGNSFLQKLLQVLTQKEASVFHLPETQGAGHHYPKNKMCHLKEILLEWQ